MTTRLNKYIADCGIASRRKAEALIAQGCVTVNGATADSPALQITDTDEVMVNGRPARIRTTPRLWCYYKPAGLVCTHDDPQMRDTVFAALPKSLGRVISVGRLDLNSEGLLLLTNQGELARALEHPSAGLERIYRVRCFGRPSDAMLEAAARGLTIDGTTYRPVHITVERAHQGQNHWCRVVLREGKNREIRKIFDHFGHRVNRLIRIAYGSCVIGNMRPNDIRELSSQALQALLAEHGIDA